MSQKLLSTIGLCYRAGGLVFGTPMVCQALQKGERVLAVLEACDTSDNTHAKLVNKCAFYHTPHHRIPLTTSELGRCIGKTGAVAALGITHEGLWTAIQKHLCPQDSNTAES